MKHPIPFLQTSAFLSGYLVLFVGSIAWSAEPAKKGKLDDRFPFRTDDANAHLPWYEVSESEFPPAGSAHYIGGELIQVDHVRRCGVLRPDRTDEQSRAFIDRPLAFSLLPYASVFYHGAPATLKDVPLGTHLHGDFYWDESHDKDPQRKTEVTDRTIATFHAFDRASRLEDDFSRSVRTGIYWRIVELRLDTGKITATRIDREGNPIDKVPIEFDLLEITRVWKGHGFGTLADLSVGQTVALNLTECTLRGPGRLTDIWIDDESRNLATEKQVELHRYEIKRRGLPGRITAVDDKDRRITVALFDSFDPELSKALSDPTIKIAVVDETLRSYEQINVIKSGMIVEKRNREPSPGNSGLILTFVPNEMLEGFRRNRIIRIFAETWPVASLPREEELLR